MIINPKYHICSKPCSNFSYPYMCLITYFLFFTYQKFTSRCENYSLFIVCELIDLKMINWTTCLSKNMKNYISLLCPIWNDLTFISRLKLYPIEYFSRLIIVNHLLRIYLYCSSTLANIWPNIWQPFINKPAYLLRFLYT